MTDSSSSPRAGFITSDEAGNTHQPPAEPTHPTRKSEDAQDNEATATHHRAISASRLFSRLPFLRSSTEEPTDAKASGVREGYDDKGSPKTVDAQAARSHSADGTSAIQTLRVKSPTSRKRKGSLRKTALLGTGRLGRIPPPAISSAADIAGLDKDGTFEQLSAQVSRLHGDSHGGEHQAAGLRDRSNLAGGRLVDYNTHDVHLSPHGRTKLAGLSPTSRQNMTAGQLTIETAGVHGKDPSPPSTLTSPTNYTDYVSTTSEDDNPLQMTTTTATARRPTPSLPAILSAPIVPPPDASYPYATTASWGWFILVVTWLTFVIGMGSCLDIWSWAWDVGETPYAPPELEDDPTLPIVGYYPALIVMTGVMAWVWVVVAWVGMKYFRHAKVWEGEE